MDQKNSILISSVVKSPAISRTFSDAFGAVGGTPNKKANAAEEKDDDGFQTVNYRNALARGRQGQGGQQSLQDRPLVPPGGRQGAGGNGTHKITFGSTLKKLTVITGQKVVSNVASKKFAAAPRDIFVYNAHPDTSPEDIKEVLTDAHINLYGEPLKTSHKESWMSSFHVRVCHEDYDKLLVPEIWPIGWKCRDFIRRRRVRPQGQAPVDGQQQGEGGAAHDPAVLHVGTIPGIKPTQNNNG